MVVAGFSRAPVPDHAPVHAPAPAPALALALAVVAVAPVHAPAPAPALALALAVVAVGKVTVDWFCSVCSSLRVVVVFCCSALCVSGVCVPWIV